MKQAIISAVFPTFKGGRGGRSNSKRKERGRDSGWEKALRGGLKDSECDSVKACWPSRKAGLEYVPAAVGRS